MEQCPQVAARNASRAAFGGIVIGLLILITFPESAALSLSNPMFTNPQDGNVDASMWLLSRSGFLAVPLLITEPAVGYGGGAGVMFLHYPHGRPAEAATVAEEAGAAVVAVFVVGDASTDANGDAIQRVDAVEFPT